MKYSWLFKFAQLHYMTDATRKEKSGIRCVQLSDFIPWEIGMYFMFVALHFDQ